MKNGAPKNAVMIPTGMSFMNVRVRVSAHIRVIPPVRAEIGSKKRNEEPETYLTI